MKIPQQKRREIVFQMLYSYDINQQDVDEMTSVIMKELSVSRKNVNDAASRMREILSYNEKIDALIAQISTAYTFERIQSVERNILRLAVFEMIYDDNIPPKVSISEAVRLARKFSTPQASRFINAILDAIYKDSTGDTADLSELQASSEALFQNEQIVKEVIDDLHSSKKPQ